MNDINQHICEDSIQAGSYKKVCLVFARYHCIYIYVEQESLFCSLTCISVYFMITFIVYENDSVIKTKESYRQDCDSIYLFFADGPPS